MKLITNGCSFTYGAEILLIELGYDEADNRGNYEYYKNYRESRTYTHYLHDKLKTTEYTNLSFGGGSNKRIVRTTLEYFMPKISQGIDVSDHYAVIQWTEPARNEIYHDGFYYPILTNGSLPSPVNRDEVSSTYLDYIKGRIMLDDKNFANQFTHDLILMASFLELHKIKYIFTHIASPTWHFPELSSNYFYKMNWVNKTYEESSIRNLIKDVEKSKYMMLSYPQQHLNIEGHKYFAEVLYKRFVELYNI